MIDLLEGLAIAQAGGGGSFGGGGGSSGGGGFGGSGDGVGDLIGALIYLCSERPLVGIPLTVVVLFIAFKVYTGGMNGRKERTIRRGSPARDRAMTIANTEALRAADPDFDTGEFLRRVAVAFQVAQDSWCVQDLRPLRPFVSDAIFERFSLQIEQQKEEKWRQGMTRIRLGSTAVIHAGSDRHFDTLTVRIPFSAQIHRLHLDTGEKIPRSDLPRNHFTECWSFLRRRGVKTRAGDGLIEQRCPNCGASLEIVESAHCPSCESLVRSGEFDWVLVEITQGTEWMSEDTSAIPGLAMAQDRDPDLNAQHLEDRVSVVFWRWVAAERLGRVDPLTRVATREFCSLTEDRFDRAVEGARTFLGDCAVGSVKTLGILQGEEWDRAVLAIRWDGRTMRESSREEIDARAERILRNTLFVLVRRANVKTQIGHTITSSHCTSCGAPDDGGTSPQCTFCGMVFNDGKADWLLREIHSSLDPAARDLRMEIERLADAAAGPAHPGATQESNGDPSSGEPPVSDAVLWLLQLAMEDGELDDKDRAVAENAAETWGVSPDVLEDLIAAATVRDVERAQPEGAAQARRWTQALVELTLSDGRISKGERRLLARAGIASGLVAAEVRLMINKTRSRLARESRTALRASGKQRRSR